MLEELNKNNNAFTAEKLKEVERWRHLFENPEREAVKKMKVIFKDVGGPGVGGGVIVPHDEASILAGLAAASSSLALAAAADSVTSLVPLMGPIGGEDSAIGEPLMKKGRTLKKGAGKGRGR